MKQRNFNRNMALVAAIALSMLGGTGKVFAQSKSSVLTEQMGIDQKLGGLVEKDVPFKDETGKTVKFGDYIGKRPVVVLPIFFRCQTGCALITDQLIKTLAKATSSKSHQLVVGKDLDVVMLGINPKETPELARNKKSLIMAAYLPANASSDFRKQTEQNWHLLTGNLEDIRKVTDSLGFRYYYNAEKDLVRHPTCSIILTPDGRISSYTIGNSIPTKLIEDSLQIATKNEIGIKADQSFMFGCIMLDPATGKIRFVVMNIVRAAGVLTLLILAFSIIRMSINSKKNTLGQGGQPTGA